MTKKKIPTTQAIRTLREHNIDFTLHTYGYEEKGGTEVAARELGVDEHLVIKTLVMEKDNGEPLLILMHGDRTVSTKALARTLDEKAVTPCNSQVAHKHTGYLVGGTSPFGTKKPLKVCIEKSIVNLKKIYINAGKKGMLAEMSPDDLVRILHPIPVNVAI